MNEISVTRMETSASNPGLGEVLDLAYSRWADDVSDDPLDVFGSAIIDPGPALRRSVTEQVVRGFGAKRRFDTSKDQAMNRMLTQPLGQSVASSIGSEHRTLQAIERLSLEILAETMRASGTVGEDDRLMVMPSDDSRPPTLLWMTPDIATVEESHVLDRDAGVNFDLVASILVGIDRPDGTTPEGTSFDILSASGTEGLAQVLNIAQPEIVKTRRPKMMRLCVPWPHLPVEVGQERSTAGLLCRDSEGDLGITACYHGTGPVGTAVSLGLRTHHVKLADRLQDIVFIPLGETFNIPPVAAAMGVLEDRQPANADKARFDGATNQDQKTRIFGTDAGLLRMRPTVQLKLQTDPDTDQGDSGSALIDSADRALGFAFERTGYDDYPQFTDWIWAANALRALDLTPIDTTGTA